jgi:hypothetical protein
MYPLIYILPGSANGWQTWPADLAGLRLQEYITYQTRPDHIMHFNFRARKVFSVSEKDYFLIAGKSNLRQALTAVYPHEINLQDQSVTRAKQAQVTQSVVQDYLVQCREPYFSDPPNVTEMDKIGNLMDASYENMPLINKLSQAKQRLEGENPECRCGIGYVWKGESCNLPGHTVTMLTKGLYLFFERQEDVPTFNRIQRNILSKSMEYTCMFPSFVQKVDVDKLEDLVEENEKKILEESKKFIDSSLKISTRVVRNYAYVAAGFELWTKTFDWPPEVRNTKISETMRYIVQSCLPKVVLKIAQLETSKNNGKQKVMFGLSDNPTMTIVNLLKKSTMKSINTKITFEGDEHIAFSKEFMKPFSSAAIFKEFTEVVEKTKVYFLHLDSTDDYYRKNHSTKTGQKQCIYGKYSRKDAFLVEKMNIPDEIMTALIERINGLTGPFDSVGSDCSLKSLKNILVNYYDKKYPQVNTTDEDDKLAEIIRNYQSMTSEKKQSFVDSSRPPCAKVVASDETVSEDSNSSDFETMESPTKKFKTSGQSSPTASNEVRKKLNLTPSKSQPCGQPSPTTSNGGRKILNSTPSKRTPVRRTLISEKTPTK